jgi:hypothetical protein
MISIGSRVNWTHPLTSESFTGTVVRIEDWFEPEKISASSSISSSNLELAASERFLIFWGDTSPMGEDRSWVYGPEHMRVVPL